MAVRARSYAWQLRDVPPGAGGFCLIPASHNSRLPIPRPAKARTSRWLSDGVLGRCP